MVIVVMEIFSTIDIKSFIAGIIITIVGGGIVFLLTHFLQNMLSRYPQKLFRTHYHQDVVYDSANIWKPLVLCVGQIYRGFLFVDIKRVCEDIEKIGIRPQISKPWYQRLFLSYNSKTNNIATKDRTNPPIRITTIQDVTPSDEQGFTYDGDDRACGRWGFYKPSLKIVPSQQLIYAIEIKALKLWGGFIDFRVNTPNGIRASHHPCKIVLNKETKGE